MTDPDFRAKPVQPPLRGLLVFPTRMIGFCKGLLHDLWYRAKLPDVKRALYVMRTWRSRMEAAAQGKRRSASHRAADSTGSRNLDLLELHLRFEQTINIDRPLVPGNKLTLLLNGPATYAAMTAVIAAARDHIHLESYIFDGDEIGGKFADALLARQAAGVQVAVIYDSVGSMFTARAFFQRMAAGGIALLEFNPLNPLSGNRSSWTFNHRDHRKLLVVDGQIAFVGGVNISETYSSAPSGRHQRSKNAASPKNAGWRDTHLKIEGPVVAEFQKLFLDTWARQECPPLAQKNFFPTIPAQGNEIVRAIGSAAENPDSPIYLTLLAALYRAQQHIHMTIAYFSPDRHLLVALIAAARRGVDVKLILPSHSDFWAIFHLGRSYYARLLRGGVQIYEREGSVMHAKTVCVDGVWSTIGSSNIDLRSFLHNDEVNAVIVGRDLAAQMETAFDDDLKESHPILRSRWRRRSLLLRIKERIARLFAYWL